MHTDKLSWFALLLLVVFTFSCTPKIKYEIAPSGLEYAYIKEVRTGKTGNVRDVYDLNISAYSPNDTLIFSENFKFARTKPIKEGDFHESMALMHVGDSLSIQIVGNDFFKNHGFPIPPIFADGKEKVTLFIGVSSIESKFEHFIRKCEEELVPINDFVARKGWNVLKDSTGILYEITQPNPTGTSIAAGDHVRISYLYYTLKEEIIQKSKEGDTWRFLIGDPSNRVTGLSRVLTFCKEGEKVRAVLPFSEAFGEEGFMPMIEPYTTVVIEMQVHQVEKATRSSNK
ncbi:MAG: hypothetical protein ACI8ZN_000314 [Bacteroidia bacterium]|jgi:hypothetical protein